MIKHERNDESEEDHIRLVSKAFVQAIKGLPQKKAEDLSYQAIKLLYVAKEYIKIMRKK
jgi:hypothetical protein